MSDNEDRLPGKTPPLAALGGLVGAAGGWALASYAGANLWIPAIAAGLLGLMFAKTPLGPRHFRGAIAVTGHVLWFVLGAIFTGVWWPIGIDIGVLVFALALLWIQGLPAVAPGPYSTTNTGTESSA